jgi:hypothetical protein
LIERLRSWLVGHHWRLRSRLRLGSLALPSEELRAQRAGASCPDEVRHRAEKVVVLGVMVVFSVLVLEENTCC